MRSWMGLCLVLGLLASGCGGPSLCDQDEDGVEGFACGGEDCDDEDPTVSPNADELCDDVDHNCDLWVHLDAQDGVFVYDDGDGDGYGDPDTERPACAPSWPETAEGGDCDAVGDAWSSHHYASSAADATAQGIKAGCDQDCGSTYKSDNLKAALASGNLTVPDVDVALGRIMTMRFNLGMFDAAASVPCRCSRALCVFFRGLKLWC